MPKQSNLILAAIGIIIVVAGVLVLSNKSTKAPQPGATTGLASPQESQNRGSLKSLLTVGKDQSCTFTSNQGKTKGTVFISGKKMSGDFATTGADNKQVESRMILDDQYSYFWSSDAVEGTKMKLSNLEAITPPPSASGQTQNQAVDINQDVEYQCSVWAVDNSKFIPPSNVTFMDVSALIQQSGQQQSAPTPQATIAPTSMLNNIPRYNY